MASRPVEIWTRRSNLKVRAPLKRRISRENRLPCYARVNTQRKPRFDVELSGVFELLAATR
jgi:hypothetical protein